MRADEEFRFQCEVRHCLLLRGISRERLEGYLYHNDRSVQKIRGKAEADRLMFEAKNQWVSGNRGTWGDWNDGQDVLRTPTGGIDERQAA